MICAECGHEGAAGSSCSACGKDPRLDGRYRLLSVIGQGAFGTTWRGERIEDGRSVCLKELLYQRLASFEPEEQFRREAAVLRQLDLPGVPDYVDDFTIATGRAVSLFLVQELVEGETLAQEMDHKRYREDEVLDVLDALLHILVDLHELQPPVVHRDIKPTNVMRRKDGSLVLIDFGAVKDVLNRTRRGGPSVAGTIGFMAPEQLQGRAEPATDLFGVGALAVALLSRRDPADLLDDRGRLDWKRHVSVSGKVEAFLDRLLHPTVAGRPGSAKLAITALEQARAPEPTAPSPRALAPAPERVAPPSPRPAPVPVRRPAAPPSPARSAPAKKSGSAILLMVASAGIALSAVTVIAVIASKPDESETSSAPVDVPTGILDLALGMTLEEAKAASTEVAAGREGPVPSGDLGQAASDAESPDLGGPRWGFVTTIAGQPARCLLEFAIKDRLSSISCAFNSFGSVGAFDAAVSNLRQQLADRYALPSSSCNDSDPAEVSIGERSGVKCTWNDSEGSLQLTGRFDDSMASIFAGSPSGVDMSSMMRTSELRLSLQSVAHLRRAEEHENREAAEQQRQLDELMSGRKAKEAEELRRIQSAASQGL